MSTRQRVLRVACLLLASMTLKAQVQQAVFVLPGANSNSTSVYALATNPLSPITSFAAGAGSFLLFGKPDSSKYYTVGTSLSQTVTSVDNTFQTPQNILNLSQPATAAVMTPDGTRLAVAAGSLHVINTTTDTDILSSGVNVGTGVGVFSVAVSLDGKTFYSLGTTSNGSQLNAIDESSLTVKGTLAVQGNATNVAVGLNGLVYVSTQNQLLEVDPNSLQLTPGGAVAMNATPGAIAFTTDGQYALVANQTPLTGSAALLVSLSNHAVVSTVPNFGIILSSLQVIGVGEILGYSSQNQTAYEFSISTAGALSQSAFTVPGAANGTTAIAITNEVPAGTITSVAAVYAVNSGELYQLNPTTFQTKSLLPVPSTNPGGAVAYSASAITVGTPSTLLSYGNNQTISTNATSRPLVVQVLDPNNHPMGGVQVNFSTTSKSATLTSTSVTTQDNGYAITYLNGGSVNGSVQVTATAGAQKAVFTITVGSGSTGGGSLSGLSIVSGQGQILGGGDSTLETGTSMVVKLTDTNGNPVANGTVTFRVSQGPGTVFTSSGGGNALQVTTDQNGLATADYSSEVVLDAINAFTQTQIAVSAPGTNILTFYMTAVVQQNGGAQYSQRQLQPASGAVLSGSAGTILTGAVQIAVASVTSVPIPNVAVVLNDGGVDPTKFASASCNDPTGTGVLSGTNGVVTCNILLGPVLGTVLVTPILGGQVNEPSFSIDVAAGPPGVVNILQGNNQTGTPGATLPVALKVQVTDVAGNILAKTPVQWSVNPSGSVVLTNIVSVTDTNGEASATATLGNASGAFQVKAAAGTASATFNLTASVPSAGVVYVSGNNQTAVINTAFASPLVVQVVDANNNGVPNVQVTFAVTSGQATLANATVNTDSGGNASTTVTAGATPGPIVITATSNGFSVTFNLTARQVGPGNLAIVNGASFDPNTGISPGSIAIITGTGILPGVQGLVTANNVIGPLPTALPTANGASALFGQTLAPIYYVMDSNGQDQMAVQVPFETAPGPVTITVTAAGGGSTPLIATVQPLAPGVFTTAGVQNAQPFAVAVRPDGSFVSATNPAMRGENITIYVTGLGPVSPAAGTGDVGVPDETQSVVASLIIGLNNSGVPLVSAVYAPGMVGVYAITITVPANTTPGPSQPLGVIGFDSTNGAHFAQATYLAIADN